MKNKVVLCVDDETHILKALKRLLRNEDYELLTAESGEEGLVILRDRKVHLVVSDQRMPDMTGIEFLQRVEELYPKTVRIVLSGYAEVCTIVDAINKGKISRFIPKPWDDDELKSTFQQCLKDYDILFPDTQTVEEARKDNAELREINENLEGMVAEWGKFLQLSQSILDNIPLPVAGIDMSGDVVLANNAAMQAFDKLKPGAQIKGIAPSEVYAAIQELLGNGTQTLQCRADWDGRIIEIQLNALRENGTVRGCLMILNVVGDV